MKKIVAGIGQAAKDTIIIVDKYPEYGLKKKVEDIILDGGGPVATALYTISKLGIKTRISTIIGYDSEGRFILNSLKHKNIDSRFIVRRRDETSQSAYIIVEKTSGDRTIFYRQSTGKDINPDELDNNFFKGISFLHLDGSQEELSIYAANNAHKKGIPVMLDAGSYRDYMSKIIKNTDFLATSSIFAERYGFDGSINTFKELIKYFGRKHLTITMGELGSITYHNNEIFRTPAYRLKVRDTTGAGDVFHGAMIFGLMKRFNIQKTIRFATVVAALKCRDFGGRRGIPLLNEAMTHLKKFNEPIKYYPFSPI